MMDTWIPYEERPAEERSPARALVGTGDCGALTADEWLQHATEVNRIEREYGDPNFQNRHTRPAGQVRPLLDVLNAHFSEDTVYRCTYQPNGQCTVRREELAQRQIPVGGTIYDLADAPVAEDADVVIDAVHNLPHRCRIAVQHAGPNVSLQERIRIQETGDYPTIHRHLRGETPLYWAWEAGYDSPTLVRYQGRYFQTPT